MRQKQNIFSASAARPHQDMANRIASSVNAAVVKIRQALLSSGYDEVGFIVSLQAGKGSLFPQSYLHGLKDAHFSSFVLVFAVVYPAKAECPLYPDTPETQEAGLAPKQAEAVTWGFVREPGYVEM